MGGGARNCQSSAWTKAGGQHREVRRVRVHLQGAQLGSSGEGHNIWAERTHRHEAVLGVWVGLQLSVRGACWFGSMPS